MLTFLLLFALIALASLALTPAQRAHALAILRLQHFAFITRGGVVLLVLAVLCVPGLVFAQDGGASTGDTVFERTVGSVLGFLLPIAFAVHTYFRGAKVASDRETVTRLISIAYGVVLNLSKFTATTIDDKAAYALGELEKLLAAEGLKMTPAIKTQALSSFQALHAQENMALLAAGVRKPLPVSP